MSDDPISLRDGMTLAEMQWRDDQPYPEHVLSGFCWCQPLAELQPNGGYVYIHRPSLDSPHIQGGVTMTTHVIAFEAPEYKRGDGLKLVGLGSLPDATGWEFHTVIQANETTVTDQIPEVRGIVPLADIHQSADVFGSAHDSQHVDLYGDDGADGTSWSAGGADVTVDFVDPAGNIVKHVPIVVAP